jgi:hypothetical protein
MPAIAHGSSIEREIGLSKKKWKHMKSSGAAEADVAAARDAYQALKARGVTEQAARAKNGGKKTGAPNTAKYEKSLRKKLRGIEVLKKKILRWETQKPNAEQLERLAREKGLIQELVKLTKMPYVPAETTADGSTVAPAPRAQPNPDATPAASAARSKAEFCRRFQSGECPNGQQCQYLHEIRPKKKSVVPAGKKRKFDDDDDDDEGEAPPPGTINNNNQEIDLAALKAQWKKLKADGADALTIKAAKKRYKTAK